jgi:hypothetical protein
VIYFLGFADGNMARHWLTKHADQIYYPVSVKIPDQNAARVLVLLHPYPKSERQNIYSSKIKHVC